MARKEYICESCTYLRIDGGDWVDYGSTKAQLPDEWDCEADWTDHHDDVANEIIDECFSGSRQNCPHWDRLPKCPKHPDCLVDAKYGCSACMAEANKE